MQGIRTKGSYKRVNLALASSIEPKSINEALSDEAWIKAIKEELQQFGKNDVWTLVPRLEGCSIFGIRWVFRNKLDKNGNIVRNKARLVA